MQSSASRSAPGRFCAPNSRGLGVGFTLSEVLRDHVGNIRVTGSCDRHSGVTALWGEAHQDSLGFLYRRAKSRGGLPVNPTRDLELPAPRPREVEIVSPESASRLLEAVPSEDRLVWATALYAGLRYGELRAIRWGAVDTAGGRIAVRESWDPKEGPIAPKTRTSRRTVPMPGLLRDLFLEWRMSGDVTDDDHVFGPFHASALYRRADEGWEESGLSERLRLHQARHTYASFMIAAGVNAKALCSYMGHSSIKVTFDLYGHLMPGAEAEAASLLDAFLAVQSEQAAEGARAAAVL